MRKRVISYLAPVLCAVGLTLSAGAGAQTAAKPKPAAAAADPREAAVAKRFGEIFGIQEVAGARRTPYGIYEVQVGSDLVYTDEGVTWVMEGPLIDVATRRDMTRERLEQLGSIPFDQFPFELAVKQVRGNGARKMVVFEDPNCGYCKQLHKTLKDENNVTIYTFLYPILSQDSVTKSRDIWCAKDRARVWREWMVENTIPPTAECDAPIQQVTALGRKLMVRGTPAIFFPDGSRLNGAAPIATIRSHLGK
ncbi:DsbC family protein [Bordetella sp. 15P40C-2]|uniref:DsbC family protein n=1 Tax=Bordetella sp. 15P40C-2 TaxID=2572246 RepID=UPI001327A1E7|nr:DsbC family protein [Bordetella sp. 15P40C-2]MVW71477.1 thioredoxin fold domain-containing protein [Bordetella sp. 15P40C-2]